jgi:hypothetical protein
MMKKVMFAAAVSLVGLSAGAQAAGCDSPFCQGGRGHGGGFFGKPMPAFQAAPWYLYWPYNQHFMTPAPLQGAFSAPPMGYGGLHNPYFPGGGMPAGGANYPPQSGYAPAPSYPPAPAPMPNVQPAPLPGNIPAVTPGTARIAPTGVRPAGR